LTIPVLVAALAMPSEVRSNVPHEDSAEVIRLEPIEVAFSKIRMGMSEKELFRLMAPFKRERTEHRQWQTWTDGESAVSVTIFFNPITGKEQGVTDKGLSMPKLPSNRPPQKGARP
jgi:hypothetical protein